MAPTLNAAIHAFKGSNRTVVLMTHRPMAIAECERLVVIENGRAPMVQEIKL